MSAHVRRSPRQRQLAPRVAVSWSPAATRRRSLHGVVRRLLRQPDHGRCRHRLHRQRSQTACARWSSRFPATIAAWNAPGHRLPEAAGGTVSESRHLDRSRADDVLRASVSAGFDRELPGQIRADGELRLRARPQSARHDRLQPRSCRRSAPAAARSTSTGARAHRRRCCSTPRSAEPGIDGLTVSAREALQQAATSSWRAIRCRRRRTTPPTFPSALLPAGQRPRARSGRSDRTADRLRSRQRARAVTAGSAAPSCAQRRVSSRRTACNISPIVTVASGRPYNILAGADLNGDGDGGTIPGPDRAAHAIRRSCHVDRRNSGTLPIQATVDVRVARKPCPSAVTRASTPSSKSSTCSIARTSPTSTTFLAPVRIHRTACQRSASSCRPRRPVRRSWR